MTLESIINEIADDNSQELNPETIEVTNDLSEESSEKTKELSEKTDEQGESLKEQIFEFAQARSELHAKIIGKDEYGRNVSDWCGCNNACTHTAI